MRPERRALIDASRTPHDRLLCSILARHGFEFAAKDIDPLWDRIDVRAAIAAWDGYPDNMSEYPTVIAKPLVREI